MAYIFRSAIDVRHNLKYELEGGADPLRFTIEFEIEGVLRAHVCIKDCFRYSVPVPDALMPAVPKRIIVTPWKDGFIPDFGYAAEFPAFIVSDRFVELLKQLEPAAHQFLPIPDTVDQKGHALKRRFFLLNVLTRLSAVDVERSTVEWTMLPGSTHRLLKMKPGAKRDQKLVLRKRIIADHHLWKGSREHFASYTFCSDRLSTEMSARGLSKLWLEHCEES